MAAAVYIKVTSLSGEAIVNLICAKTKVAPLQQLTIPRLEVTAALLLSNLVKYVQATLQVDITSTTLWTDSSVTLTWICTHPSRWKDFVRNRVATIQQLTSNCSWRYVPGKQNPADCASRGISLAQLTDHSLWWTGPPWLSLYPKKIGLGSQPIQPSKPSQEARPGHIMVMTTTQPNSQWELIFQYSKLRTLLHVIATIIRATDLLKGVRRTSPNTALVPQDLERAKIYWAKSTQAACFTQELLQLENNPPTHPSACTPIESCLSPTDGILRRSRLAVSWWSTRTLDTRLPGTTSNNSAKALAVYNARHSRSTPPNTARRHSTNPGRNSSFILDSWWKGPVKSFILRCMCCARKRGNRAEQLMGQLPPFRVQPSRAFQHAGVDYAGPLTIKSWKGRGAKQFKAWISVFVCMSTSAVHIDVVCDYTSESFIAAYRRFTALRGICHSLYSNCGTTFLGPDAALKLLFNQESREGKDSAASLADDHTHWLFNPPAAPHMGCKWEAAVKSIKFHLKRTMGETTYTLDEITTLLTQIEALLNFIPLEPLSD